MPLLTLQQLAARERTRQRNRQLGGLLAFMAGAINAGGFLAVQRYTSHMTGVVSSIADDLVLGQGLLVLAGVGSLLAFIAGAAVTAILINWARRRQMQGEYALSLLLEAALLLLFGLLGANLNELIEVFMPTTVLLLCFIMGLQNAIVTKISQAEIRTTHMTGVITDLGIELGRLLYWNRSHTPGGEPVRANRDRLRILSLILGLFFAGGLVGAWAFKTVGYGAVLPLAAVLAVVALPPLLHDVRERCTPS
ncbi:YoaK family protein [Hydrogenophaga atypica]|uniref:YoaK family protein n=1 Tax=Hydrogenophaga atypica TaxID=249409 RepID=A0ABW2QQ49_9BURK